VPFPSGVARVQCSMNEPDCCGRYGIVSMLVLEVLFREITSFARCLIYFQYKLWKKEHVANREQIVYIAFVEGRSFVGPSNPGHKERSNGPCATSRRRILHGQIEGS
jgi:hypothetical protein